MNTILDCTIDRALRGDCLLQDVTFALEAGEALGITGNNGAGKTTLLDAICGFVDVKGSLKWKREEFRTWPAWRRHQCALSRMFQHCEVTVSSEAVLQLTCGSPTLRTLPKAYKELLDGIDIKKSLSRISYGQARRVFLTAILARSKNIALLDEPFDGFDDTALKAARSAISKFLSNGNVAVIVDHHPERVCLCGKWIRFSGSSMMSTST